jgi:hypothetical protein
MDHHQFLHALICSSEVHLDILYHYLERQSVVRRRFHVTQSIRSVSGYDFRLQFLLTGLIFIFIFNIYRLLDYSQTLLQLQRFQNEMEKRKRVNRLEC